MSNTIDTQASQVSSKWQERLSVDFPEVNSETRQGILRWLLKEKTVSESGSLPAGAGGEVDRRRERRYRVLRQRYWQVNALESYYNLLNRLGSLAMHHPNIRRRLSGNPRQRQVFTKVIQEVLQDLVSQDTYLQQQINWIAQCTQEKSLRERLFFASLEEYCFRCCDKQPRFIEHLVRLLQHQLAAN